MSVLVVLAGTLALSSTSALAAEGHKLLTQLKEAAPGSPLEAPEAVAVDPSSGDVFVTNSGAVDVFSSAGVYKTQFGSGILGGELPGLAVDKSGRVYVADLAEAKVVVFKPNGSGTYEKLAEWTGAHTLGGSFEEPASIAVDDSTSASAGDVYVVDRGSSVVDVFEPQPENAEEPVFVKTLSGKPELEELGGVAVSAKTGKVYVGDTKGGETGLVEVFSPAHAFETKLTGKGAPNGGLGPTGAVAVEDATGDVYVADTEVGALDQLNPAGEWIGWLRSAPDRRNLEPTGVALAASGDVYLASPSTKAVYVYGPNVTVPNVKTVSAKSSKSKPVVVTFTGKLNPLGTAKYHFEYGQNGELNQETPTVEASGTTEITVTAAVEHLKPGAPYSFRLVAENESEAPNYGMTVEFVTAEAVAGVTTGPALNVTPASATLTGSLEPQKFTTKYYFEWGENAFYGHSSPVPFAVTSANGVVPAETNLTGLKPNTTYHYRLVAANQFGVSFGADAQFSTSGPGVTILPAGPIGHQTATLNASINPNKLETKYHFAWGEKTTSEHTTPEGTLPPGEKPEPVKAELTGLKLATTYHFRIVASNAAGTVEGPDQEFTTVLIDSESATNVTSESAVLNAGINPLGVDTKYHFEYGVTTGYGTSIPVPDGDAGSGSGDVAVSAQLLGLQPNTTYHYRVVATVAGIAEPGIGPDRTLTTLASGAVATLPDGRAYEMVSPPDKHGGYIEPMSAAGGALQSSEDGSALAYVVNGPIVENPEGNRSPEAQQTIATRSAPQGAERPGGWTSQEIVTPHDRPWGLRAGQPPEYQLFSYDLALAFVQPFPFGLTPLAEPPLAPPATEAERGHQEKTMYIRNDAPIQPTASESAIYKEAAQNGETLAREHGETEAKPGYLPLVTAANVAPGTKFGGVPFTSTTLSANLAFKGANHDLTHVVLHANEPLAPEGPSAAGLYEWSAGKLQLVSVLPCTPKPCSEPGKPAEETGASELVDLGYGPGTAPENVRNAISSDGARVFWTYDETISAGRGHLYVRDTSKGETLQVDVPEEGLPTAEKGEALYEIASSTGSRVFFTDPQKLTTDSTATSGKPDLYVCDIVEAAGKLSGCKLTDLSVDHNAGESAAVEGAVLGAAEDGSYVYFVANGALEGAAKGGGPNLYVAHDTGGGWTTKFIARLSPEDAPDWFTRGRINLVSQTTHVSPSGNYLAFMSKESLTGYDNTDVNGGTAAEEVFLYNAGAGVISCVSCNPTGARPNGVYDTESAGEGLGLLVDRPTVWIDEPSNKVDHWLAGSIPGSTPINEQHTVYQSRYLSDSGRMFFTSADPLVPAAAGDKRTEEVHGTKITVGVENVYQYEPSGVGSCTTASGCVALISSGASPKESAFLDASVSGNDVFFLTASPLLPQDKDATYDIYDARVCSEGSPCVPPPPPPTTACADAESCKKGGAPTPPSFTAPPSSTFSGPGNSVHAVPSGATLPSKSTKPKSKALTNAQKLAKALKACRKLPHRTHAQKSKRAKCEAQARRKYRAKKAGHAHGRKP